MKDVIGLRRYAKEHRVKHYRERMVALIGCHAPEYLFAEDWENLSDEAKEFYEKYFLPCEGTGNISTYCEDCPFSVIDWDDDM